jgi:NADPH-dependent 2,4-dienoyl-CoA reductase/sulfur reductase-like enzyme
MNEKGRHHATLYIPDTYLIIGGGFIGAEIAAALAMNGKDVVMAFPGETIGSHIFPHDVGVFLNDVYRQKGVQVLAGERILGVEQRDTQLVMHTRGGQELKAGCLPEPVSRTDMASGYLPPCSIPMRGRPRDHCKACV